MAASGQFSSDCFKESAVVGELALEGHTRPIKGALSMAMAAREAGYKGLLVPNENAGEAAVLDEIDVIPISSLSEAVGFFAGTLDIDPQPSQLQELFEAFSRYDMDFGDVRGQEVAKRALTISAAGAHKLLMLGPPGSGKPEDIERPPSRRFCRTFRPYLKGHSAERLMTLSARLQTRSQV